MTLQVAHLTAHDGDLMARLHPEGFDAPWSANEFAKLLATPGAFGFYLSEEGREDPAGFVLARLAGEEMEIITLVIARDLRRKGYAAILLSEALALARQTGSEAAFLEVAEDNQAAQALYRSIGFAEVGRRPGYYERPGEESACDALVLRLDLSGCALEGQ